MGSENQRSIQCLPAPFRRWVAQKIMGDAKLKVIATELITKVRQDVSIDWTLLEGARARIRFLVRRILNKGDCPPDLQDEALQTVLRQAKLLCAELVRLCRLRTMSSSVPKL